MTATPYLHHEAQEFLQEARADQPLVLFLKGPLGIGKTTFVKALLDVLSPGEGQRVQSPTFLKLLEYPVSGWGLCVHIDAYRIEDIEGVERLGLENYSEARLWLIEWPDVVEEYLKSHPGLRKMLGWTHYWEVCGVEEKMDPILGSVGGGEDHSKLRRTMRWSRKLF